MLQMLAVVAMTYAHPEQRVETDWGAAHAAVANVRVVDMRQTGYADGQVPGAVYVSPVAIRDAKAPPTFLPTAAAFEEMMAKFGIGNATRVVVYDERGGIYAARLWWILNYFGHTNVALMNGGWTKWTAEQRPVTTEVRSFNYVPSPGEFTSQPQSRWIATAADVVGSIDKPGVKIVDARTQQAIDDLTADQREWVRDSEALWSEAHAIAAASPGIDSSDVYHALRCLELTPAQRLGRGLTRVRTRPHAR